MAQNLWGKVYFKDKFAGYLNQEPGERYVFKYDQSCREAISVSLPLREEPYLNENGLHPYFDNLVSEGWLASAHTRLLGKRTASRFELLLAFGFDCIGAVSIVDPEPSEISDLLLSDPRELLLLTSKASLSGVQAKLALVKKKGKFFPSSNKEISTHIAKFSSADFPDLIENEFLCTLAFKNLLPREDIVDLSIGQIEGLEEKALIIKRFDRQESKPPITRIHFEEFSQLLGLYSIEKYSGDYSDMAKFIETSTSCLPAELFRLYQRIIVSFLLGNTDMHFKNFAMLHTPQGLRLSPVYDQVCAMLYGYKNSALAIAKAKNIRMSELKAKHIVQLGEDFNLSNEVIATLIGDISSRIESTKQKLQEQKIGSKLLREKIITNMEKQWKITFASIGKVLSKRQ